MPETATRALHGRHTHTLTLSHSQALIARRAGAAGWWELEGRIQLGGLRMFRDPQNVHGT